MSGGAGRSGLSPRAAHLARLLHERRIARLHWSPEAETNHVLRLASLLAAQAAVGGEIDRQLRSSEIHTLRVEPLDLGRIHDAFRESPAPGPVRSPEERARLEMQENVMNIAREHPEEVAKLIRTWLAEE